MDIKKIVGPIMAFVVVMGVLAAMYTSYQKKHTEDVARTQAEAIVDYKGLIGSEKQTFFADERVQARFLELGVRVSVEKIGSREISSRDLTGYDFGFPAGAPAAIALQQKVKAKKVYSPFYTPMAVASWKPLLPIMEREGLVKRMSGAYYIIDMKKLLKMVAEGKRWKELAGNTVYPTSKSILISSTDVRKSNSAAMYLSLASYVMNGNDVVSSSDKVDSLVPELAPLFAKQGLQEASSAGPFEDYTTMGMGKAPLVMIYESQFLEYQSKRTKPNADMVLLYPLPTLYTKHVVVPFNPKGDRLGELMTTDPKLQQLAVEYGYRTSIPEHFAAFVKSKNLEAPDSLVDVIDPPSYELLEKMIKSIEKTMQ